MVVTVVLRLLPGPLESGELVGHAELVASGVSEPVKSAEDVIAFARKVVTEGADPARAADVAVDPAGDRLI